MYKYSLVIVLFVSLFPALVAQNPVGGQIAVVSHLQNATKDYAVEYPSFVTHEMPDNETKDIHSDVDKLKNEDVETNNKKKGFQPSDEWQAVKDDQPIPKGLHIKMNLHTHEKYAKLLKKEDRTAKEMKKDDNPVSVAGTNFTIEDILTQLNHSRNDTDKLVRRNIRRFRSMEEMRKEFSHVNFMMRTHTELLIHLLRRYEDGNDETKVSILEDLEFLVHQYDVAQDFVKIGGMDILLSDLNTLNSTIKAMICFTLGSAMQGNPKVQIAALQNGILPRFLDILTHENSTEIKSRTLFALSGLIRNFPMAQEKFVNNNGFKVLSELFTSEAPVLSKLKKKAVTIVYDLVSEQQLAEEHAAKGDKIQQEKLTQYKRFNIKDQLKKNGFCYSLPVMLHEPDYDSQERVIKTMLLLVNTCKTEFMNAVDILDEMAEEYKHFANEELASVMQNGEVPQDINTEEFYFYELFNYTTELISSIKFYEKDEL